jgi:uncharacterized protein (DUF1330 family)
MAPIDDDPAALTLCVLLWARDGQDQALADYEDAVLGLAAEHGGAVLQRARRVDDGDGPQEVQMLRFGSSASFESYLADPRRLALQAERDAAVARTEVIRVTLVG